MHRETVTLPTTENILIRDRQYRELVDWIALNLENSFIEASPAEIVCYDNMTDQQKINFGHPNSVSNCLKRVQGSNDISDYFELVKNTWVDLPARIATDIGHPKGQEWFDEYNLSGAITVQEAYKIDLDTFNAKVGPVTPKYDINKAKIKFGIKRFDGVEFVVWPILFALMCASATKVWGYAWLGVGLGICFAYANIILNRSQIASERMEWSNANFGLQPAEEWHPLFDQEIEKALNKHKTLFVNLDGCVDMPAAYIERLFGDFVKSHPDWVSVKNKIKVIASPNSSQTKNAKLAMAYMAHECANNKIKLITE